MSLELRIHDARTKAASVPTWAWRFLLTVHSLFCAHEITLRGLRREGDGSVSAPCVKCGRVLHGACGLALNAKFVPEPPKVKP